MTSTPRFQEDFRELTAQAAAVSVERCGACQNRHMLWPMLRLARIVSGVEGGREAFADAITRYCKTGRERILIAGAADSGILCLAANATQEHGADFVIFDVCDTPLELCRRFARRWGLRIETHIADAKEIEFRNEFDIIIAHSLLQFIPPPRRVNVFSRFAAALKPDGVVIQVFNAGARIEGALATEHARDYPELVMARFEQCGIVFPEPREKLRARLQQHSLTRRQLEGAVATPEEFDALMEAAGFTLLERQEIDLKIDESYGKFLSKLSRRKYLSIARARSP